MDLDFFRRASRRLDGRRAARLDYGVLVATLEAMQSSSPAARAALGASDSGGLSPVRNDALVELLLGGAGWRAAIASQRGSFHPALAAALCKAA